MAAGLSAEIYLCFKTCTDRGFKDQITRSGLSIPSNIAEGLERNSDKESSRFLDIALGSAAELKTQIYIGMNRGKVWVDTIESISRMINGLKRSIHKKTDDRRLTTDDRKPEVSHA